MNFNINTKVNVFDLVYYMRDNKICKDFVDNIHITIHAKSINSKLHLLPIIEYLPNIHYKIRNNVDLFEESKVFKTKEDLIKSL